MGRALDILRGKVEATPGVAPFAVGQRSVVVNGSGGARWVEQGALGSLHVPGAKGWHKNTTAARCVATIAANLASVDLTVLRGDEADDTHPVAQLWNVGFTGNPVSARITREVAFAMAEVRGEGFIYLDRGPTGLGPVRYALPIYDEVDVHIKGDPEQPLLQQVAGYVVRRGNQKIGLLPSEVLWLRYPHPTKEWAALAPWAASLDAVELDSYARAWQLGEFKNGAKPGMLVYLGDVDESTYNKALAEFRTSVEGAHNAGKSLLVAGPTKAAASRLSLTPEEMSYLASRAANREEVMLAFGIRPDFFVGQSTFENQRAAKTALWSDLLLPKLDVLGSEVDRQLLPDPREQAAFDVSKVDALQENQDAIYTRVQRIATTDVATIDELRAQLGLEPLPNGEGQYTLTEYRARIALRNAGEMGAPAEPRAAQLLLPRPRRVVAVRGSLQPVHTRARRRTVKRPSAFKFYDTHERVGQRVWAQLAEKQLRVVLRNLGKLRTSQVAAWAEHRTHAGAECVCERIASDDVFDAAYWQAQTAEATDAWLRGVWEGAGSQMADALGIGFDVFDQRVLTQLELRRDALAAQVTQTTRRVLDSQLLAIAAEEGWSVDAAEEAIRGVFGDLSSNRARTIARTEVVGGYNAASNIAAKASGIVTARRWLTAEDERVRPSHARLNGERLDSPTARYSNGLLHPGDPSGDPAETINCRCVELYDVD